MGAVDTVNGAINPDEPFSKEHWMNSLGVVMRVAGAKGALSKTKTPVLPKNPVEVKAAQASKILNEVEERIEDSSKILEEQIRKRVLENIGKSKIARAASNFDEYLKKEKELLEEIEKKKAIEKSNLEAKEVIAPSSGKAIKVYTDGSTIIPIDKIEKYIRGKVNVNIQEVNKELRELKQLRQIQRKVFDADPQNAEHIKRLESMKHNFERSDDMRKNLR